MAFLHESNFTFNLVLRTGLSFWGKLLLVYPIKIPQKVDKDENTIIRIVASVER